MRHKTPVKRTMPKNEHEEDMKEEKGVINNSMRVVNRSIDTKSQR